jgi:hypothetical protein
MTQPNATGFAQLIAALGKGDARLVTIDGFATTLPAGHRPNHVVTYPFTGVGAIERANRDAGYHWFEQDSMRFFGTKILRYFGAGVFTTRETNPSGKTAWSIRVASQDGSVSTFGEFHAIPNSRTATTWAKYLVALLDEGCVVVDSKGQTFTLAA